MSKKKLNLLYNEEQKTIDCPNYFDQLEDAFFKEFNCNRYSKVYTFNYLDSDNEEYLIDNDTDYCGYLEKNKNNDCYKIKILAFDKNNNEEDSNKVEENHKEDENEIEVNPMKSGHNFSLMKQNEKKKEEEKKKKEEVNNPTINIIEEEGSEVESKVFEVKKNNSSNSDEIYNCTPGASDSKVFPQSIVISKKVEEVDNNQNNSKLMEELKKQIEELKNKNEALTKQKNIFIEKNKELIKKFNDKDNKRREENEKEKNELKSKIVLLEKEIEKKEEENNNKIEKEKNEIENKINELNKELSHEREKNKKINEEKEEKEKKLN